MVANIDTTKLKGISPEAAELRERLVFLSTDDALTTITRAYIEAIARQFLDQQEKIEGLEEENETLNAVIDRGKSECDIAYKSGKEEGYRKGVAAARQGERE